MTFQPPTDLKHGRRNDGLLDDMLQSYNFVGVTERTLTRLCIGIPPCHGS